MATVFFSYSHADEDLRNKLEEHLALLKRQGLVEAWHDRRLAVGDELDPGISAELERADVVLLLVSSAFLASNYCYEREMSRALERHSAGSTRVIPVILRHCDWMSSPFGKLLAAPRDGRPVTAWPDIDEAMADVVRKIRDALLHGQAAQAAPAGNPARVKATPSGAVRDLPRSSNLRVQKGFTEADRDRFLDGSFEYLARFFEGSLDELKARNEGIETAFRRIDADRFSAVIYRGGKAISKGSVVRGGMFGRGISWAATDRADPNSCNDYLLVEDDGQILHLKAGGMSSYGRDDKRKLTQEGAGEYFWDQMMQPLQRV